MWGVVSDTIPKNTTLPASGTGAIPAAERVPVREYRGRKIPSPRAPEDSIRTRESRKARSPGRKDGRIRSVAGSTRKRSLPQPGTAASTSQKSKRTKANAGKVRSTVGIDNEHRLATELGPHYKWIRDNGPVDIVETDKSGVQQGFEVKTLLTNQRATIHIDPAQRKRKLAWLKGRLAGIKDPRERRDPSYDPDKGRRLHVVVIDHREAYADSVSGSTDFANRKLDRLYYSRGVGTRAIKNMIGVRSMRDLKYLQTLSDDEYETAKEVRRQNVRYQ